MDRLEQLTNLATDIDWLEAPNDSIFLTVFDWYDNFEHNFYLKFKDEKIDIEEVCLKALKTYYRLLSEDLNARLYVTAEEYKRDENNELYGTGDFYGENCIFSSDDDLYDVLI